MNYEETKDEKKIREVSELSNPYAKTCPNRHLWSEGFRAGTKYNEGVIEKLKEDAVRFSTQLILLVDNKENKPKEEIKKQIEDFYSQYK